MLADEIIQDTEEAICNFGSYQFHDKGPEETMDIAHWVGRLRELPPAEAAEEIFKLARHNDDSTFERVAHTLVSELDDWDELFEIPTIASFY